MHIIYYQYIRCYETFNIQSTYVQLFKHKIFDFLIPPTSRVSLPIEGIFLKTIGEHVKANVPSYEDLLGDKLTAFAPHTTGSPFFKGEKNYSMEINKQLYDISKNMSFANDSVKSPIPTELNKLKKTNPETFFLDENQRIDRNVINWQ